MMTFLKKGGIVLLDNDFIYYSLTKLEVANTTTKELEKRYLKDKLNK